MIALPIFNLKITKNFANFFFVKVMNLIFWNKGIDSLWHKIGFSNPYIFSTNGVDLRYF